MGIIKTKEKCKEKSIVNGNTAALLCIIILSVIRLGILVVESELELYSAIRNQMKAFCVSIIVYTW